MGTTAEKISKLVLELGSEISDLNRQIDEVNADIQKNAARPPAREEIEKALREKIDQKAARYKESLKFEFHRPFPVTYVRTKGPLGAAAAGVSRGHDGIDILRLQNPDAMIPGIPLATDLRLLEDAFAWTVKMMGKPAIDDLMTSALTGGISRTEKDANDVRLKAKKRQIEMTLEETYVELERCGMQPDRRPDLSADIFLEFDGLGPWNRGKLEAMRQRVNGWRAQRSNLNEKRQELDAQLGKLQQLQDRNRTLKGQQDNPLDLKIAALVEERKVVAATLDELNKKASKESKFFQRCVSFLREHGVEVERRREIA